MSFSLAPVDNQRLAALCGQLNANIKQIESELGVEITQHGPIFSVRGSDDRPHRAERILRKLYDRTAEDADILANAVHLALREVNNAPDPADTDKQSDEISLRTHKAVVRSQNANQRRYLHNILSHDINFGIGPAGTGKTYLAVACAVHALLEDKVSRIILVRPAVEAGERLGFLPGDIEQKVDPYLRPLYDALYELLGMDKVAKFLERNIIELAPLAYMRGRTLNECFVILDEAQNTTVEQMKMFLTRIGFGSKAVITGDITQTDLPRSAISGLKHTANILKPIQGISFSWFTPRDVVRHPLVQQIVEAYDRDDRNDRETQD